MSAGQQGTEAQRLRAEAGQQARAGRLEAALRLIDQGLALEPGNGGMQLQRASYLSALGRKPEARVAAESAAQLAGSDAGLLDAVGTFFSACGEQQRALALYERALSLAPQSATLRFNRAAVRRFLGDLAGAESDYDAVIQARPDDCEAWLNRSELRPQTPQRNHVRELERLLGSGLRSWQGEVQIRHALAKEYDDLGDYTRAWGHLSAGAALRRRHLEYDVERDVQTVDWICRAFPDTFIAPAPSRAPAGAPAPIFIVGLPRTGSTLLERMLSRHSAITSAGELDDFARALTEAVRRRSTRWPLSRAELVAASARLDFAALGADYLARATPVALTGAHFIDKMPLNYLYCGLIARALPGVRIIHVTRAPMAVCHAMYSTLFRQGYPFSYDLSEIGRYYLGYRRLMVHWEACLPGAIHRVSYESLVEQPEAAIRGVLGFCGLEWEDSCLEFASNPIPTTTASAAQVRRGLYRSSLERWRHYERELRPLAAQLAAGGVL